MKTATLKIEFHKGKTSYFLSVPEKKSERPDKDQLMGALFHYVAQLSAGKVPK